MNPPRKWSFLQGFLVGRNPRATLIRIAILVGLVSVCYQWVIFPFRVTGDSMLPTLLDGQVRFAWRTTLRSASPQRGDLVIIDTAGGREFLLKRIIALPGEKFSISNGVVYINGERLEEPYIRNRNPEWNREEWVMGPEEYFFVGDNRTMDMASHVSSTVQRSRIKGMVIP